jgi:hypothetical protein
VDTAIYRNHGIIRFGLVFQRVNGSCTAIFVNHEMFSLGVEKSQLLPYSILDVEEYVAYFAVASMLVCM